jgi:hypothetical protein
MRISVNTTSFEKQMNNIIKYSSGFLEGAQKGKVVFLKNLGRETIEFMKNYVDVSARSNPEALHHVYEWYQTGSPNARLFDLNYTVSNLGLSISGTFKQSNSIQTNSRVPFYDKAMIMEKGIPVKIVPKKSPVLVFEKDGETIFTNQPVSVKNPGGDNVQGSFEKVIDQFILLYFKQSFLRASGLYDYIKKPVIYKKNIAQGARLGKAAGFSTGFTWIANAKIGVE